MGLAATIAALSIYAVVMLAVASLGERAGARLILRRVPYPLVFGFGLAVYCTSWTYYGAVGTAASGGWEYLAIYLGPILAFTLGAPVIARMIRLGREQNATSIADFISTRYERSRTVAALVAIIAVLGALPYIALQLRSVTETFSALVANGGDLEGGGLFLIALALAGFSTLFGARTVDQTRQARGIIAAIAFDSALKIFALALVAIVSAAFLLSADLPALIDASPLSSPPPADRFAVLTLLAFLSVFCLPRQFHMMVVSCLDEAKAKSGGRIFIAYLLVVSVIAPPIAIAGAGLFPAADISADLYVLALPKALGAEFVATLAFIGGVAAGTGMVIVASVALSGMIANDLITPLFLNRRSADQEHDLSRVILGVRRISIFGLLMAAASVAATTRHDGGLAGLGIVSFAAAAQFAPALFAGLYWRRSTKRGAVAGLSTGLAAWALFVLTPELAPTAPLLAGLSRMLLGVEELGIDSFSAGVVISMALNAGALVGVSLWVSAGRREDGFRAAGSRQPLDISVREIRTLLSRCIGPRAAETALARFSAMSGRFPRSDERADPALTRFAESEIGRAVGASSARALMKSALTGRGVGLDDVVAMLDETSQRLEFSRELLQTTLENITQGVAVIDSDLRVVAWNSRYLELYPYPPGFVYVGRPIADLIRYNAEQGACGPGDVDEHVRRRVARLKERRAHEYERRRPDGRVIKLQGAPTTGDGYVTSFTDVTEYKRIEQALIASERSIRFYTENIPAMFAFSDQNEVIRFVNKAYREQFGKPGEDIVGMRLTETLDAETYRARKPYIERALSGEEAMFDAVLVLRSGDAADMQVRYTPQFSEDGAVLGFFGVYQDVTARRAAERALSEAKASLEHRVEERTRDLSKTAAALEEARTQAEEATRSKTRFLAAASHDVLQPLNAARLFTSALKDEVGAGDGAAYELAEKIAASIGSADRLLRSLLDISRLDAGGITAKSDDVPLDDLFEELTSEFGVIAGEKGLLFRCAPTSCAVRSDRGLLRSALQNLVSNAVRYTSEGRVVIGARRRGDRVLIEVYDTGPGIAEEDRERIFGEFQRLGLHSDTDGAGLGLAIVARIAAQIDAAVSVRSRPGAGSCFVLDLPRAQGGASIVRTPKARPEARPLGGVAPLVGQTVLCVDNDRSVLEAMDALLTRWGARPVCVRTVAEARLALQREKPALMVLDHQLDHAETGFDVLDAARSLFDRPPPVIFATASQSAETRARAMAAGAPVLEKPVEASALRAVASQLLRTAHAAE